MGNPACSLRAYVYARLLGREGMHRLAEFSTLNANYIMAELAKRGFDMAYPKRQRDARVRVDVQKLKDETGVSAMDIAKRLHEQGLSRAHDLFPATGPECPPDHTNGNRDKERLDRFIAAMEEIVKEVRTNPELVKGAPHTLPVKRLDDVRAARELDLTWKIRSHLKSPKRPKRK